MNIFNLLMNKFHDDADRKESFLFIIIALTITIPMKYLMPKRFNQYFDDKNKRVLSEIGPPKFSVDMEVNVLTSSMVDESFIIKTAYLDNSQKIYVYDLEDAKDGTEYSNVPEKFLYPMNPHALATNNVSFSDFMDTLNEGKKKHHDIGW